MAQTSTELVQQLRLLEEDERLFGRSYRMEGDGEIWRIDPREVHVEVTLNLNERPDPSRTA